MPKEKVDFVTQMIHWVENDTSIIIVNGKEYVSCENEQKIYIFSTESATTKSSKNKKNMNYMIYPFIAVIGLVGVKTFSQYFSGVPRLSKEEVTNLLNREDELVDIINASIPAKVTPISVWNVMFTDLTNEYTELNEIREKINNNLEMVEEIISEESSELEKKVIGLLTQEKELVKTINKKTQKSWLFPNITSEKKELYNIRLKLRKGTQSLESSTRNYPKIYSKIKKQEQQARQKLEQLKTQEQNIEDQLAKEVSTSTMDQVKVNQSTRGDTLTEAQEQEIDTVIKEGEEKAEEEGTTLLANIKSFVMQFMEEFEETSKDYLNVLGGLEEE
jgi:chromosome segregation ATPase